MQNYMHSKTIANHAIRRFMILEKFKVDTIF